MRYLGADGRVQPPDVADHSVPAVFAEYDAGLTLLFEDLPCTVVNRIAGGMSNHSKPYQALLVRACGLETPPTLVSNDPDAVRRFYDEHRGEVIYKSLSGVRSIVRKLGADQLARLPFLKHGPAQCQAFIPGDNVRVHTVGDDLFVTRVRSTAVDYRYARTEGAEVEMIADTVPPAIAEACLRVAREMDLVLSGIDLKCTPDGQYLLLRSQPLPGLRLLRALHETADQPCAR